MSGALGHLRSRLRRVHRRLPSRGRARLLARIGRAWLDPAIPDVQGAIVDAQLSQLELGIVLPAFEAAAAAVDAYEAVHASVLEVGCASGYYGHVLRLCCRTEVSYTGVDLSVSLLASGRRRSGAISLIAGDAERLPFAAASFDLVLSAAVLMHVSDWQSALLEASRVARVGVILHRTPITDKRTTEMYKEAYGVQMYELVFNRDELLRACQQASLVLMSERDLEHFSYPAARVSGRTSTLVFRKATQS